ncbi:hypothetical protein B1199_17650 [Pseudoalteromonas ulvae]|uniref:Uncharacterized protein n=1 Tax=Pseudoalteromonas ulvae TaxID=107327 RepID=A0A244CLJ7_PSEDV|nr:hypothetical protein B1199_17650 [Pseudoalteromonas ulvae]
MTLTQIIEPLGETMSWFERELQWGVCPTELRHLSGRIGELYSALITNGQMAMDKEYFLKPNTSNAITNKVSICRLSFKPKN